MGRKFLVSLIVGSVMTLSMTACGSSSSKADLSQKAGTVGDVGMDESDSDETGSFSAENISVSEIPMAEGFDGGDGTETAPYQISTKEQLRLLAEKVNENDKDYVAASYVLNNDIEINSTEDIDNWESSAPEYIWTVIGNGESYSEFEGHFDGQGHIISGLFYSGSGNITGNSRYAAGLFGIIGENAVIENVTLDKSRFYVSASSECGIGGIVGETADLSNAEISRCDSYADIVVENGYAGGIAGKVNKGASIEGCMNYGTIEGRSGNGKIGGIAGGFSGYKLTECQNRGFIRGSESYEIGGLIGDLSPQAYLKTDIKNADGTVFDPGYGENILSDECYVTDLTNMGEINRTGETADHTASLGGVIGSLSNHGVNLTVSNLTNEGVVSGSDYYPAGVVGYVTVRKYVNENSLTSLSKLENYGELNFQKDSSDNDFAAGGVIGYLNVTEGQDISIDSCKNAANLEGNAGGIIGTAVSLGGDLKILNCENSGTISSKAVEGSLGGIINILTGSTSENNIPINISIEKCVNSGSIDGKSAANGGIIGWTQVSNNEDSSFTVQGCENSADVSLYFEEGEHSVPIFAAGIIGWLGIDKDGRYTVKDNVNSGNIVLKADSADKDTIAENIKYYRSAAIVGMNSDNAILSGNKAGGKLLIPSIGDFSYDLSETGMEISITEE